MEEKAEPLRRAAAREETAGMREIPITGTKSRGK